MDATDRRILRELQADARRPNKALAAAAGVSPSTMHNRVRSLEQRGVVRGYHAEVDPVALGRSIQALVLIRLQPKTPAVVEDFMATIWALDETIAVTAVTGPYDVLVHLAVADVQSLGATVLGGIASHPAVVDEQTSIIFEHRRKRVLVDADDTGDGLHPLDRR